MLAEYLSFGLWHCVQTIVAFSDIGIFLAYAGGPLHSDDAKGEVDGAGDIEAAVGDFLDASGLEAFLDAADAQQQAITEELLGDLSLDGHEPSSNSLQS